MTDTYATDEQRAKLDALKAYLAQFDKLGVAFSGGVDSSFLLYVAHDVLGDRAVAYTAHSALLPARENGDAEAFCERYGIKHVVFEADNLDDSAFTTNPPDRCYRCKTTILETMYALGEKQGVTVLAEGSNMDDEGDFRPGLTAVAEQGVKSPLRACGLYKRDIRNLSRDLGLPTWNKQSLACLASRFAYGDAITQERLRMVDAAEETLADEGFATVRVRIQDKTARIEIDPADFARLIDEPVRSRVIAGVKAAGFDYVTLDLQGYRTGAMNETLSDEEIARAEHPGNTAQPATAKGAE